MKSLPGILWLAAAPTLLSGQSTFFAPPVTVQQWHLTNWSGARCEYTDIDGDGVQDVVGIGSNWFLRGATSFANWSRPILNPCTIVGTGDFNRDGRTDVLGSTNYGSNLNIYEFDPYSQQLGLSQALGWRSDSNNAITVADFNNDGWEDVVHARNGQLVLWLNFGGQFLSPINIGQASTYRLVSTDVDNDNDIDLVSIDYGGETTLRINQGGAFFSGPYPPSAPSPQYPTRFHVADCNGDGLLDIISTTSSADVAYCLYSTGGLFASWRTLVSNTGRYRTSSQHFGDTMGDVDGDGDEDLIWFTYDGSSQTSTQLTWHQNPALRTAFNTHLAESPIYGSDALFCYDADGDGDLDIGQLYNTGLDFWENVGRGTAASATVFGVGCGTSPMTMTPTSLPRPGDTMSARIQGTPSPMCTIALGFSNTVGPGGAPLPADLTPIGMPGCHLYQAIDENLGTSSAGVAYERLFAVPLPPDGRLLGTHLYTQAITLSYGVNPLGVVTSNAIDWSIGGQ